MAQLLVRKIDDDLKSRLKMRAASHGHSMEAEARAILADALLKDEKSRPGLGTRMHELFSDIEGWDGNLPEIPDEPVRAVSFDE